MVLRRILRLVTKKNVKHVTEQAPNREHSRRLVRSVMDQAVVYTQQSLFGQVRNVQTCPECGGAGKVVKEKCPKCAGQGFKKIRKPLKVTIPAGVDNGISVRVAGFGEPGKNGGPRGDLLVGLQVDSHPIFQRQVL